MRHMKQLFLTTLLLLTSIAIKAQSDPEQEIFFSLINKVVTSEEESVSRMKKKLEETPKEDTAKIQRQKSYLEKFTSNLSYAVLIQETTKPSSMGSQSFASVSMGGSLKDKLPSFDSVMFADMIQMNERSITIESFKELKNKVTYLAGKELNLVFKGGWDNYYKIYKYQPIISYSRPGFNATKDKAMIYYSTTTGGLSGAGYFLILEKVNGKWIEKESFNIWIS